MARPDGMRFLAKAAGVGLLLATLGVVSCQGLIGDTPALLQGLPAAEADR